MESFTPFSTDAEIKRIATGMLDCTLPASEWTHAAHFAATLWLMTTHPQLDLPRAMPHLIRTYNESVGGANTDTSGYHETITQASLRAARAFMTEREGLPLYRLCNELMASPLGRSDWLLTYWSRERLFSVEARRTWVEPDVQPLPF